MLASEIDLETRRALIRFDAGKISSREIIAAIERTRFKAEFDSPTTMPTYEIEQVPVVCGLMPPELKEREETLLSDLGRAIRSHAELDDGFSFRLDLSETSIRLAADVINAESQCCPFLHFRMIVPQNRRGVWLEMRGPAGAKDLMREILPPAALANPAPE